jgi:hypothetical protein
MMMLCSQSAWSSSLTAKDVALNGGSLKGSSRSNTIRSVPVVPRRYQFTAFVCCTKSFDVHK